MNVKWVNELPLKHMLPLDPTLHGAMDSPEVRTVVHLHGANVAAEPGQVTSIVMHFKEHAGDYVWHCHLLEHEDNDMMRPLVVVKD